MQLLVLFGPPAVGKMTVGREIVRQSDFRLFHNHASIEPLLDVFDYGTTPFNRLQTEIRNRVIEEAARAGTNLVFTYVWALELAEDAAALRAQLGPYLDSGADVAFVELYADLPTRLERNRTELRLAEKKSKRDLEFSDANVRELDRFVLSTSPTRRTPAEELIAEHRFLRVDNSRLEPAETAAQILAWLRPAATCG